MSGAKIETRAFQTVGNTMATYTYMRDDNGHLMCSYDKCSFKPKATPAHPHGNPSTMHYHIKTKHTGEFAHVCSVCKHGFLHAMTLQTHMAARHPEVQQNAVEVYKCPLDNCDFESLTKANRRIHFLRKHCHDQVVQYQGETIVEGKKAILCGCCNEAFKSGTAFHYHIGSCMISKGLEVHSMLELVC